jgi:flagellar biosynthesis/type III secretory pathway protein FliH
MPNRMFDPVSNPFAIQNLLEKKVETFIEQPDERAAAAFTFDSVVMANPVHAFSEQVIDDPAAGDAHEFQAEWMDAGNEFATEEQATAGDFVAGQGNAVAGFSADGDHDAQAPSASDAVAESVDAAPVMQAETGDTEAVTSELVAEEPDKAWAGEAVAEASMAGVSVEAGNDGAISEPGLAVEAAAAEIAITEAVTAEQAADAMDMAEQPEAIAAEAAQEVAPAVVAEAPPVVAVVQPGITEEELNARLEAAREEGRAEVRAAVHAEAHKQGHDEGHAAGYAQAKEELGKAYEEKIAQLQSMVDAMQELSYNPDAMFEPMKALSIHIAEQLVRGELSQSPQAISRLVDNCLRELNASGEKAVIIHLHPEDVEHYKPQAAMFGDALVLRADPKLERGSVRASLEGSVVEDLIQRRVAGLKKGLMQAPAPSWRANAARLSDRIADGQRGSQQVEDVTVGATVAESATEGGDA